MLLREEPASWDFTPVINLVYTLTSGQQDRITSPGSRHECIETAPIHPAKTVEEQVSQLGNFDEIWKYLNQSLDRPPPVHDTGSDTSDIEVSENDVATTNANGRAVRWQDEAAGTRLEDNHDNTTASDEGNVSKPTKQQRKKERRRQRKEMEAAADSRQTGLSTRCDNNSDSNTENILQRSNDRRVIIQQILRGPSTKLSKSPQKATTRLLNNEPVEDTVTRDWSRTKQPSISVTAPAPARPNLSDDGLAIAAAKKAKLLSKLRANFVDEGQHLGSASLVQHITTGTETSVHAIHVFVDISNILIGFHDALKLSRGLSVHTRIRRQPLSFHNLSLILERGRPAVKRVLVGSDNYESIQEAKLIGYETNILDRVHKAKALTPRQKKYRNGNANAHSGQSSGSETNATHGPEKWVEQAVDEILHLKILESIVDAKKPSTIVLATGDAAEAEYSEGFLKMVERALEKRWKVELVSFRHNTSGAYRRKEFRSKWGESFKTIELDEFAEELLGS